MTRLLLAVLAAKLVGCGPQEPPELPPSGCADDSGCLEAPRLACRAGACVEPVCAAGSIYVPSGRYVRGCQGSDGDCDASAQPAHTVTLSHGFCLAATELTVGQYRACLAAGHCPPPSPPESLSSLRCSLDQATWTDAAGGSEALPMTCLLWAEAAAACASLGGRLPTEAEWERAARGSDGRAFPWGRSMPVLCDQGVNFAGTDCSGRPWPAAASGRQGAMVRSPFGALDLAGNVSEWVADAFAQDAYGACRDGCTDPLGPTEPAAALLRARRGGSFASRPPELRAYAREFHLSAGPRSDLIGVRCASSPER